MHKLSITIITKNEEHNIKRCLDSVKWADEIIIVDSGSVDKTIDICREYGCKIIETEWRGFGKTKQLAVNNASNDWILSVDADEIITEDLKDEIISLLSNDPPLFGYRIKRRSFYLGKRISFCGWDRDYTLRLFNRQHGAFNDKPVHESVRINGDIGHLKGMMLHYTYPTIDSHYVKMKRYADIGAQNLYQKGRNSNPGMAIIRGIFKFIKMYIFQLGFLDGKHGFLLSYNSAWGVYLKYLLLWEMNRSKSSI